MNNTRTLKGLLLMNKLIIESNELFKNCGFPYYICGGFALELFLGKTIRTHGDLDISIFEENRKDAVELLLATGWDVYQRGQFQKQIFDSDDPLVLECRNIWAIKPGSPVVVAPIEGEENLYDYKIVEGQQTAFNFIEMVIDIKKGDHFGFRGHKVLSRAMDKAILYKDGIPYMAPELVLFLKSHKSYLTHEFHKEKTPVDFKAMIPALPDENREWLINAIELAYPKGNVWLEELKK